MDSSKTDRHYHFQSDELVLFLNVYSNFKKKKKKTCHFSHLGACSKINMVVFFQSEYYHEISECQTITFTIVWLIMKFKYFCVSFFPFLAKDLLNTQQ